VAIVGKSLDTHVIERRGKTNEIISLGYRSLVICFAINGYKVSNAQNSRRPATARSYSASCRSAVNQRLARQTQRRLQEKQILNPIEIQNRMNPADRAAVIINLACDTVVADLFLPSEIREAQIRGDGPGGGPTTAIIQINAPPAAIVERAKDHAVPD